MLSGRGWFHADWNVGVAGPFHRGADLIQHGEIHRHYRQLRPVARATPSASRGNANGKPKLTGVTTTVDGRDGRAESHWTMYPIPGYLDPRLNFSSICLDQAIPNNSNKNIV